MSQPTNECRSAIACGGQLRRLLLCRVLDGAVLGNGSSPVHNRAVQATAIAYGSASAPESNYGERRRLCSRGQGSKGGAYIDRLIGLSRGHCTRVGPRTGTAPSRERETGIREFEEIDALPDGEVRGASG